jgi:phosphatidylinositol kinase/protein kinase (PI-3  family)
MLITLAILTWKCSILERKKESRRRNIAFHLPVIVPLAPLIRLVQDDLSYASLQDIYEDHCLNTGIHKDDPILYYINRMKELQIPREMFQDKVCDDIRYKSVCLVCNKLFRKWR